MNRIPLSAPVVQQLCQHWIDDVDDCTTSMMEYYNHKGWKLSIHGASWSIPEDQATFFILTYGYGQ